MNRAAGAVRVRVWDPLVRIAHWSLIGSIVVAWFTRHGGGAVHEWAGYLTIAVVSIRVVWGFVGPRHARFTHFVRPPAATSEYAALVYLGREPRYLGHNPLGGWMIVALLATALAAAGSGWLYVTDRFWGLEWVEELHIGLSNLLFGLAGLHVAGVVVASWRHRENLAWAMVRGNKREAGSVDID